jgi:hypothetical protein
LRRLEGKQLIVPRYYFDVHDGMEQVDRVGSEWPDLAAARDHALDLAGAYTKRSGALGSDGGAVIITVRDAAGETTMIVRLACSVESCGGTPVKA